MSGSPVRRALLATAVTTLVLSCRARRASATPSADTEERASHAPEAVALPAPTPSPVPSVKPVRPRRRSPKHLAPSSGSRRVSSLVLVAGAAVLLASAPGLAQQAAALSAGPTVETQPRLAPPAAQARQLPVQRSAQLRPTARPSRLLIASIGLDSRLTELGLRANGHLQAPPQYDVPGWFADGPRPGAPGAALIVGHVDSTEGPAVFYRLERLRPGDVVVVGRQDGTAVRFQVDRLESFRKDSFPTDRVFGGVRAPELRLITCFGSFDKDKRSYTSNLVVSAHLVSPATDVPVGSSTTPSGTQEDIA